MTTKNVMFNQSQKQDYIDFEKLNSDSLRRYFVRLAPKEKEYKKDIVDMDINELEDTILYLGIRREESRGHLISLLRGYINWAILNERTENIKSPIEIITPENTSSQEIIRKTMIKNPEHLKNILDNVLDYVNYENRSNRDSLIFWLLYFGLELEEMILLKKNDIDKETKIVKAENDKKYEVNDEVLKLWGHCSEMTFIERKNGKSKNAKNKQSNEYSKYFLVDNNYLFRPIQGNKIDVNSKCSLSTFRSVISKVFQDKERNIPARNINYSGKFYQIYLLEKNNLNITPKTFAEKFGIKPSDDCLSMKTRKWRIDYEDWKLAFGFM